MSNSVPVTSFVLQVLGSDGQSSKSYEVSALQKLTAGSYEDIINGKKPHFPIEFAYHIWPQGA